MTKASKSLSSSSPALPPPVHTRIPHWLRTKARKDRRKQHSPTPMMNRTKAAVKVDAIRMSHSLSCWLSVMDPRMQAAGSLQVSLLSDPDGPIRAWPNGEHVTVPSSCVRFDRKAACNGAIINSSFPFHLPHPSSHIKISYLSSR